VSRWGEIRPNGWLFPFGSCLKITEVAHIFWLLNSVVKFMHWFRQKNWLGDILGHFFANSSGHPVGRKQKWPGTISSKVLWGLAPLDERPLQGLAELWPSSFYLWNLMAYLRHALTRSRCSNIIKKVMKKHDHFGRWSGDICNSRMVQKASQNEEKMNGQLKCNAF
jgi:hypothetical protein